MIKVYSLVGKSGTGKSFHADEICHRLGIEGIIDDGLLIEKGGIMAGISAKRQETKIGAVKTALFSDDNHRDEVAEKIRENGLESILVIGTSENMIKKIIARLQLPDPIEKITIESITTEEQRNIAKKVRNEQGGHIIPARSVQIKRDFSGYFIHPLRSIKSISDGLIEGINPFSDRDNRKALSERTVVRPTYSYLGKFSISDRAIADIITLVSKEIPEISSVVRVFVRNRSEGAVIEVALIMKFGFPIIEATKKLQELIAEHIEEMTSINVLQVDMEIKRLSYS